MADAQRSAFTANLKQLAEAIEKNDDAAGKAAATGLATLVFFELDRVADALERIADASEKTGKRLPDLSQMRFG